jgi:hypothetical protein
MKWIIELGPDGPIEEYRSRQRAMSAVRIAVKKYPTVRLIESSTRFDEFFTSEQFKESQS